MALNPIQVAHVNEVIRPGIEQLLLAMHLLDTFNDEHTAFQASSDALPTDGTVLDDALGGVTPRADAPSLTGAQVDSLLTTTVAMRAQVNAAMKTILLQKAVRSLANILR